MRPAGGVIILALIGVSQLPVGEGRVHGSAECLRGDNRGDLLAPTIGAGEFDSVAAWGQLRSGDHGCDRVQNMMFCIENGLFRWLTVTGSSHVLAELGHHRAHFLCSVCPSR